MAKKYYAVKEGRTPGIYYTWDDCKKMVDGYSGAKYKSFSTIQEAEEYISGKVFADSPENEITSYAFVDGSYNETTRVYGYGGFLMHASKKYVLQGNGNDEEMASMRNVAGEVLGSMAAMEKAIEIGIKELTIYYDYMGIEMWATGAWKRNKKGTVAYFDYVQNMKEKITLNFVKVKGHSGVDGNEEADRLAKEAVGIL